MGAVYTNVNYSYMIFSYFPCHGRIQGTKTCYSVIPMDILYCSFACLLSLRWKDPDLYNSFGLFQLGNASCNHFEVLNLQVLRFGAVEEISGGFF